MSRMGKARAGLLMGVLALAAGCGAPRKVLVYPEIPPGLQVMILTPRLVAERCGAAVTRMDDGSRIPPGKSFSACYLGTENMILISWNRLDLIYHELCHASGRPRAECAEVF